MSGFYAFWSIPPLISLGLQLQLCRYVEYIAFARDIYCYVSLLLVCIHIYWYYRFDIVDTVANSQTAQNKCLHEIWIHFKLKKTTKNR